MPRQRTRHGLKAIAHALKQLEPGRLAVTLPEVAGWATDLAHELADADLPAKRALVIECALTRALVAYTNAWILSHKDDLVRDGSLLPIIGERTKLVTLLQSQLQALGAFERKPARPTYLAEYYQLLVGAGKYDPLYLDRHLVAPAG